MSLASQRRDTCRIFRRSNHTSSMAVTGRRAWLAESPSRLCLRRVAGPCLAHDPAPPLLRDIFHGHSLLGRAGFKMRLDLPPVPTFSSTFVKGEILMDSD